MGKGNNFNGAGEYCTETGIYVAAPHQHYEPHRVIAVQGERFPACRKCFNRVICELREVVPLAATHDLLWYVTERPSLSQFRPIPR